LGGGQLGLLGAATYAPFLVFCLSAGPGGWRGTTAGPRALAAGTTGLLSIGLLLIFSPLRQAQIYGG
jgi:hypothetical protein